MSDFESSLSEYSNVIKSSDQEAEAVPMTIAFERYESLKQQADLNQEVMRKIQSLEVTYKNLKICVVIK